MAAAMTPKIDLASPVPMTRVGIFGGTFDPVHVGHVEMAQRALAWGLDGVLVVPCRRSPHKLPEGGGPMPADGGHRWAMLGLAFAGQPGVSLSRTELDRPGPSYTRDTVKELRSREPATDWFLILGGDQLPSLRRWIDFNQWAHEIGFLIFSRPGHALKADDSGLRGLRADFIRDFEMPVSATEIRARLANGEPVRGMVPAGVEAYIRQHGLYGAARAAGS